MSNLINGVNFSLSSLANFDDREFAERVIRAILNGPDFAVPKKYGRDQPLTLAIDPRDISSLIDLWVPRTRRHSSGPVKCPDGLLLMEFARDGDYLIDWKKDTKPSFAGVSGAVPWPVLDKGPARLDQFIGFIKNLVGLVNPVYGDIENMALPDWDTPLDLQKRLPDIPWVSIYGEPYIKMFGEKKIETAPFCKIERLPSGHYFLQATKSVKEPVPASVRASIRRHLGEDSFMAHPKWRYKTGKAPEFDFRNMLPKYD
jgi:hypothetical protein